MKLHFSIIVFLFLFYGVSFAQNNDTLKKQVVKDKPVRSPFESGYLLDNQTTYVPIKKTLEFVIQHKFGTIENGVSDLFGIYGAGTNIRLAMNYVPINHVQIGYGITKKRMTKDFNIKWSVFEQTRKNTFPVAVTLFANMAVDGRNSDVFGVNYVGIDRLSYFSQIIVSRKFNNWLTLEVAGSYTHYNIAEKTIDHNRIGVHFNGRVKFSPQSSFIFNYDLPLDIKGLYGLYGNEIAQPKSNLAIGYEISTSSHAFQIVFGTADGLIPQDIVVYNQNDWTKGQMGFGFTITRLWNF